MLIENQRLTYEVFRKSQSAAHGALITLGKTVDENGLEKELTELVKLRVSQINGCAFCLQLHLNIARKLGVDRAKLDLVTVWRDAEIFSARETAAFAWAERLTHSGGKGAPNADWAALLEYFTQDEAVLLTITVGTINNWNRIAIGLQFPPPLAAKEVA